MIKIEHFETSGWLPAIRGMRNPMNSWEKSDSEIIERQHDEDYSIKPDLSCEVSDSFAVDSSVKYPVGEFENRYIHIGKNDMMLMKALRKGGADDRKFLRMITVYCDITAPLYWWKEFDTYKVGTVANSCSTMHKIHSRDLTIEDFSTEHLGNMDTAVTGAVTGFEFRVPGYSMCCIICAINDARKLYIETNDKKYWNTMIQLLPTSYNQKRTVMMNYEVLVNMYHARKNHKLDEWHDFCHWVENLPYANELIIGEE